MNTPLQKIDYCYSLDEELFDLESMGDVVDAITNNTDEPVGATYWRGEKQEMTLGECIDVDSFLEMCDERAYEEIGEFYDNCFTDVTDGEKQDLQTLITEWAKKNVNMRYWKVINTKELKLTAEDIE